MLEASDKQKKAAEILDKFSVTKIAAKLLSSTYKYESSSAIQYLYSTDGAGIPELRRASVLSRGDQRIIVGLSDWRTVYMPDDSSEVADAYVFFNEDRVLQTSAHMTYGDYDSKLTVSNYAWSIKLFKAGPWLKLLGDWYGEVKRAGHERDEKRAKEERRKRDRDQESKFDFGDYE